jgi:serine/threonine protein kinase
MLPFKFNLQYYSSLDKVKEKYKLTESKLLKGGNATIFINDTYALKLISNDPKYLIELHITQLGQSVAPKIYEVGYYPEGIFMVMAAMESDLTRSSLSKQDVNKIFATIRKMHMQGIYHNDLFVKNILRKGKDIKITDFGRSLLFIEAVPKPLQIYDYITFLYGEVIAIDYTGLSRLWHWMGLLKNMGIYNTPKLTENTLQYALKKLQTLFSREEVETAFRQRYCDIPLERYKDLPNQCTSGVENTLAGYIEDLHPLMFYTYLPTNYRMQTLESSHKLRRQIRSRTFALYTDEFRKRVAKIMNNRKILSSDLFVV